MSVETFYLQCLAHASYIVYDQGVAVLVDPRRDVAIYQDFLKAHGLRLKAVLLTHNHADFVAGHAEMQRRANAVIAIGRAANVSYPHLGVATGDVITLSDTFEIRALETPGHTPGCVSWILHDRAAGKPVRAFTGDTLFVGNVGRPDLLGAIGVTAEELARTLYTSLHTKLMTLPDDVVVHPAHGAGSPCGKGLSTDLTSTIGKEKLTNPALQCASEGEFVAYITTGQPHAPQYFLPAVVMNMTGEMPSVEEAVQRVPALAPEAFAAAREQRHLGGSATTDGLVTLDTREADDWAAGHVPGSISAPIGISGGEELRDHDGNFGIWVGTLVSPKAQMLIVAPPGKEEESLTRLARIGYHNVVGYLDGGFAAWAAAGLPTTSTRRVVLRDAADLEREGADRGAVIVDVREPGEYGCPTNGHVKGAINMPLPQLPEAVSGLDRTVPYLIYCNGGYRSSIAMGFMESAGLSVQDIVGGYRAISAVAKPLTTAQ